MFYPYFSYITYELKSFVAVLEYFVRITLLKVRGWLRIEIGWGWEGAVMAPNPKFRYDFSDYNPKIWYDFLD